MPDNKVIETAAEMVNALRFHGYTKFKNLKTGDRIRNVTVLVPGAQRPMEAQKIGQLFEGAQVSPNGKEVLVGQLKIVLKPTERQGAGSAGAATETRLLDSINQTIQVENEGLPITVVLEAGHRKIKRTGVKRAISVATTSRRNEQGLVNKSDIDLETDSGVFHISVKDPTAQYWESPDAIFKTKRDALLDKLSEEGRITITREPQGTFAVSPRVAFEPTNDEVQALVFGADIASSNGVIMEGGFFPNDFVWEEVNNTLRIKGGAIYTTVGDIPRLKLPVFVIRQDRDRNKTAKYPGLRVIAPQRTYIEGRPDVLFLSTTERLNYGV